MVKVIKYTGFIHLVIFYSFPALDWKLTHGIGLLVFFSNGDQYEGDWVRGMKQGHGTMKYNDGTIFDVSLISKVKYFKDIGTFGK